MNAIECRKLAHKAIPDLDRLRSVINVEIKKKAEKGYYQLKRQYEEGQSAYIGSIRKTLEKEGFTVNIRTESRILEVNW